MKSKIHRATVTDANPDYEGSISIDASLMEMANILPYEKIDIYNITNGERFSTYAIEAPPNSGTICINGAAAHKAKRGNLIIIASYQIVSEEEARRLKPMVVRLDSHNRCK